MKEFFWGNEWFSNWTPIEILFGYKPQLPPDINLQLTQIKCTPSEYSVGLAKYLSKVKIKVFNNLEKAHIKGKIRCDSKHKDMTYTVGYKVLFFNPTIVEGRTNKMLKKYNIPYVVVRQCSPVLYELNLKATPLKSNIVRLTT